MNSSNVLRSPQDVISYPRVKCSNYPKCHEFSIKIFLHELSDNVTEEACRTVLEEYPEILFIDNVVVSLESTVTLADLDLVMTQLQFLVNWKKQYDSYYMTHMTHNDSYD